jgi:hypothetical protein
MTENALSAKLREMVRRDIVRGVRSVHRPGTPVEDGRAMWVRVPVSNECWEQVYGQRPPTKEMAAVRALLRYHEGKREWLLESWTACRMLWACGDERLETLHAPEDGREWEIILERISPDYYGPWGIGPIEFREEPSGA